MILYVLIKKRGVFMFFDMDQTMEDVRHAIALLHSELPCNEFRKYSGSFLFTTENQEGIEKVLDYKNKTALVPASSGDQYLGAVYYDAEFVRLFDVNRMTFYVTYLKIAAVRVLDYRKFISFFVPTIKNDMYNHSFWNLSTLKRLLPSMPGNVGYFWDSVMYEANRCGFGNLVSIEDYRNKLSLITKGMPFYANEREYYKLQAKLRRMDFPNFTESDILKLGDYINTKHDVVYLSNIVSCLVYRKLTSYFIPSCYNEDITERQVVRDVLTSVLPLIKDDGIILLDYRPNRDKSVEDWLYIEDAFDVTEVPSKYPPTGEYNKYAHTDLVLTFRPKKDRDILKHL